MEATEWFIVFLVPHLYLTVFLVSAIDATGVPFPGRIILVLAGAFANTRLEVALAIVGYRLWRRRRHGRAQAVRFGGPYGPE